MANLKISHKQRVLHIVLNRPEKRNALSAAMCRGISDAISEAQNRADVGVILISALGAVFCAGMDLEEASGSAEPGLTAAHEALFTVGSKSIKPILIAVNGAALGGGVGLVAQGHYVLASEAASFALPEIRVGLWPFLVYRSVEVALGARRVLALSLTGENFYARDALSWGLAHDVCPQSEMEDRARALARSIAKASPLTISIGMQYVREARGKDWDQAGALAAKLREQIMHGEDFKEGRLAFKEKREPVWPSMRPDASES